MSVSPQSPISVRFREDSSAVIMCRLLDRPTAPNTEGAPLVQADFSAIALTVWDVTGAAVVTNFNAVALTVSAVIFDTLQGWKEDFIGHNFRYTVGATAFPTGDSEYSVEVKWTLADGRVGWTTWLGKAEKIYGA